MPRASTASRYWGNVSNSPQGTPAASVSKLMSSTCWSVRASSGTPSARMGAMEKPQLPAMTDVTPWKDDGVRFGSQKTCAS